MPDTFVDRRISRLYLREDLLMIDLEIRYPGQITAADANYPSGSFKNESSPGLFDGTPFEKAWVDDIQAMLQGLIKAANITINNTVDTVQASQILEALTHYVTRGDFFVDSGAADAYVLAPLTNNYDIDSYQDGMRTRFIPDNTNTGASTVNISGVGVKNIKTPAGGNPIAGDIPAGIAVTLVYDLANDWFILDSTAVGGATRQPLTESFTSAEQTITAAGLLTIAHGLSNTPYLIVPYLINKTAEFGYSIGDEVMVNVAGNDPNGANDRGISIVPDGTNVNVRYGLTASPFAIMDKTTGLAQGITNANWRLIIRAWA
jgi:hypothetical protein